MRAVLAISPDHGPEVLEMTRLALGLELHDHIARRARPIVTRRSPPSSARGFIHDPIQRIAGG
jgi:hypothetical protein